LPSHPACGEGLRVGAPVQIPSGAWV
jgi:hypothetical protein